MIHHVRLHRKQRMYGKIKALAEIVAPDFAPTLSTPELHATDHLSTMQFEILLALVDELILNDSYGSISDDAFFCL